jgi:RimJ/RimL family protein N-acetyltransferase
VRTYAHNEIDLEEIVSFTATINVRSRRVMDKIGLIHSVSEDFDHPRVAPGNPLRPHVLYRGSKEQWRTTMASA